MINRNKTKMNTKPALHKILKGTLLTEDKNNYHERMVIIKSQEKSR
jgi:hypothetical protein